MFKYSRQFFIFFFATTMLSRGADDVLTLRGALSRSLRLSPELATFPYDERAAEARILQAGLKPNPEVSIEVQNFGGQKEFRGLSESETTLQLGQLIEFGGKRAARVREATAAKTLVQFDYEAKRLEVLGDTAQAFFEVLGAQERVRLNAELAKLAAAFGPAIQKRVEAGKSSAVEQARNEVAVASARIVLEQAESDLGAARRRLAAKWGATQPDFGMVSGRLDSIFKPPPFADYVALLPGNPSVARWKAEAEKRRASLARERAEGAPDVTLSAGPVWLAGSDAAAVTANVSVPLPLQNRNQGAIREAGIMLDKIFVERKAAEASIAAEAGDAYEQMVKAFDEIQILNSSVLPNAQKAMDSVEEGYDSGRFSQLDVLDARRTINEARAQYLEALVSFHRASAQLDALTGATIKTLGK